MRGPRIAPELTRRTYHWRRSAARCEWAREMRQSVEADKGSVLLESLHGQLVPRLEVVLLDLDLHAKLDNAHPRRV